MRGNNQEQSEWVYNFSVESRVPKDHPIRRIREISDRVLGRMSRTFSRMYSRTGRPSIAPERLVKSILLMSLYSIRSDRQFCEMLEYNFLYRWFLGMGLGDASFDHSVFTKNRERFNEYKVAERFFGIVVRCAQRKGLISEEHFSADGTQIEAWASMKSVRRKDKTDTDRDDNPQDFRGEKFSNETHQSITDPDARFARKGPGKETKLSYHGNMLIDNRGGFCIEAEVVHASGTAEYEGMERMVKAAQKNGFDIKTVGADKNYHTQRMVSFCKGCSITPHFAIRSDRQTVGLDKRTTNSVAYAKSLACRPQIEGRFGWLKRIAGFRKTRFRGIFKNNDLFKLSLAAFNILRLIKLTPQMA